MSNRFQDLRLTADRDHIKQPGQTKNAEHLPARYSEIGCRHSEGIFLGDRLGESDVGIEAGSYDAALHMAGIETTT